MVGKTPNPAGGPISLSFDADLTCTTCGAESTMPLWIIIDKDERPDLWQLCLDDQINIAVCRNHHATKMRGALILRDASLDFVFHVSIRRPESPQVDEAARRSSTAQVIQVLGLLQERLGKDKPLPRRWVTIFREDMPTALRNPALFSSHHPDIPADVTNEKATASSAAGEVALANLEKQLAAANDIGTVKALTLAALAITEKENDVPGGIHCYRAGCNRARVVTILSKNLAICKQVLDMYGVLIDLLRDTGDTLAVGQVLLEMGTLTSGFTSTPDATCDSALRMFEASRQEATTCENIELFKQANREIRALCDRVFKTEWERPEAARNYRGCALLCDRALDSCGHGSDDLAKRADYWEKRGRCYGAILGTRRYSDLLFALGSYSQARLELASLSEHADVINIVLPLSQVLLELATFGEDDATQAAELILRQALATVSDESLIQRLSCELAEVLSFGPDPKDAAVAEASTICNSLIATADNEIKSRSSAILGRLIVKGYFSEHQTRDDVLRALALFSRALDEASSDRRAQARLLADLSQTQELRGDVISHDDAQRNLDKAQTLALAINDVALIVLTAMQRAGSHARKGEYGEAAENLFFALIPLEGQFKHTPGDSIKLYLTLSNFEIYRALVDFCLKCAPSKTVKAFENADNSRSQLFREFAGKRPLKAPPTIPAEELEREQILLAEAWSIRDGLEVGRNTPLIERLRVETMSAIQGLQAVESELDTTWIHFRDQYGAMNYVRSRTGPNILWSEVKSWLQIWSEPVAIIAFFVLWDRTVAFIAHRDLEEPEVLSFPLSQRDIAEIAASLTISSSRQNDTREWNEQSQLLSAKVISPLMDKVPNSSVIYFIKHLDLHFIPLHAIPYNNAPLISRIPVAYASSIASLMQTVDPSHDPRSEPPELSNSVVVGDPINDLPGASEEAALVHKCLNGDLISGSSATVMNSLAKMRERRIVHFAGHSLFDQRRPERSGIVLADGVLGIRDLTRMPLDADVVTLSSCSSGVQRVMASDELWGIPRFLLAGGAASCITTLWDIADEPTTHLMTQFYRLRYGTKNGTVPSKAEALARACLDLHSQGETIAHWAPFILHGDFR
jgi:CHAT domain-containing protein